MQLPSHDLYPKAPVEEVPIVRGGSGLTGRQQIVRDYDVELDDDAHPEGLALPTPCLRALQLPEALSRPGERCPYDCAGRQEDGACLADLVRSLDGDARWHCEVKQVDEHGGVAWTLVVED